MERATFSANHIDSESITNTGLVATGTLTVGGSTPTALLAGFPAVAGTLEASKVALLDANKDVTSFRNLTATNLKAGKSGTAGTVTVFPATGSKGSLVLACADQTGNTAVTVTAAAMGQATAVSLPDPGVSASHLMQSTAATTLAEADVLHGVTPGTTAASKALVTDANSAVSAVRTASLRVGASGSELIVPTAATITVGSVVSHVCAVTVQLKDSANNNVDSVKSVRAWLSDTAGGIYGTALSSEATVASTALLLNVDVTEKAWHIKTTATGSFVITLTQTATQNSYLNVILSTGAIVSSAVIAFP